MGHPGFWGVRVGRKAPGPSGTWVAGVDSPWEEHEIARGGTGWVSVERIGRARGSGWSYLGLRSRRTSSPEAPTQAGISRAFSARSRGSTRRPAVYIPPFPQRRGKDGAPGLLGGQSGRKAPGPSGTWVAGVDSP